MGYFLLRTCSRESNCYSPESKWVPGTAVSTMTQNYQNICSKMWTRKDPNNKKQHPKNSWRSSFMWDDGWSNEKVGECDWEKDMGQFVRKLSRSYCESTSRWVPPPNNLHLSLTCSSKVRKTSQTFFSLSFFSFSVLQMIHWCYNNHWRGVLLHSRHVKQKQTQAWTQIRLRKQISSKEVKLLFYSAGKKI